MLAMKVAALLLLSTILVQARHVEKREALFDPSTQIKELESFLIQQVHKFAQVFLDEVSVEDITSHQPKVVALFSVIGICGIALLGLLVFTVVKMISCLF